LLSAKFPQLPEVFFGLLKLELPQSGHSLDDRAPVSWFVDELLLNLDELLYSLNLFRN
jgi:hypothetical protein